MVKTIYLDNAATTKVKENVAKAVNNVFIKDYGNASSIHAMGKKARELLEKAREDIARYINADKNEIIFTSGGTESNNLAILGVAKANSIKKHIITSLIEHPAIIEVCKELEKQGYKIDCLGVNEEGLVDIEELKRKITKDTLLVSIMHVNNEIGVIQPIEEIGKICNEKNVLFHSDCVQSFGKLKIDVKKMKLDMLSVSGHKINAPKGIGFLYVKKGLRLNPLFLGGGQEKGIRSGTENTPGIVGLAEAIKIKRKQKEVEKSRNKLLEKLLEIPKSRLNGSKEKRIWNNINISFYGIEGEGLALLLNKKGICVSTGSACSSHKLEESHVLKAINTPTLYIHGSIRISLDTIKPLNDKEIEFIAKETKIAVDKLRKMSPFQLGEK